MCRLGRRTLHSLVQFHVNRENANETGVFIGSHDIWEAASDAYLPVCLSTTCRCRLVSCRTGRPVCVYVCLSVCPLHAVVDW